MTVLTNALKVLAFLTVACSLVASQVAVVSIPQDRIAYEFVGQFNNTPTTSQQFGYLSTVNGLASIFTSDTTQNETTALLTFVTNATTDRVIVNGPFKIINRTGTTTIYLNTPPSDFNNPSSFSQGTPVQVSSYKQQVILNGDTSSFVTVHINNITETHPFLLNGKTYQLGREGASFRTNYSGQVNTTGAAPTGWFGGNAVGVRSEENEE
jgi:hypothetical protein